MTSAWRCSMTSSLLINVDIVSPLKTNTPDVTPGAPHNTEKNRKTTGPGRERDPKSERAG